ncbi:MAG: ATP-binding protein [Ramlibacter sp.]
MFPADALGETRLQAALTAGNVAAWYSNLQTRERWWSPEMFAIHGLAGRDAVPEDYLALVHAEDRALVQAAFAQSVAQGQHEVQYRVAWPDGSVHWVEGVGRTTRDANGRPHVITGVCAPVDERRRQEEDLRFLAQASATIASSTGYRETLKRVATLAVPHFADWCAVDMLEDGELRRLAVAHVDAAKVSLAQELYRRYPPDRNAPVGAWHVVRTGQPEMLSTIPPELLAQAARDADHLAIVQSLGLHSYMGIPIQGPDGVLGVISFVSSDSRRVYQQRDLDLATDLVSRAAVAIENARLFQALRASQARQSFLLSLTDVLRGGGTTHKILSDVSAMLGGHFGVNRVGYGHVDESLDRIDYDVCWTDGTATPLLGEFPASAFGPQVIARLRAGQTIVIANVREHPLTSEQATVKTSREVDTRAILVVPLFKAGRLRTIVYLNQRAAREWTPEEVSLMEEVAERTRELIERGRTEEALRASEARWRSLFERMAEGFFVAEAIRDGRGRMHDFRFLQANPAFEKLTGVAPAAAIGRTVTEVVPGVQQDLIDTYARVVDTGQPAEFEVLVPALNDRWYEARASRVAPDQFSVLFLEITERKVAQLEQARAAERYRTLFESIDEAFCILDVLFDAQDRPVDYRFVEVNPAFERHAGLPDAVGRTIREMVPDIESAYIETYGRVALTGEPIRFESQAQPLNRWFDAFAFRVGEPRQRRVALLFTDITDRKRAEQALRESDTRKDEFLATLAHELRNPLAPMRNGLAILGRADAGSAAAARARELMERQFVHLVRLVDDLLDVSRVSRGKVTLKKAPTTLQAVAELALEASRPLLDAARHSLVVELPPEPVALQVDATRMAQVLSNLLNNAAKYTPAGGRIVLSARVQGDGRLQVSVADNGMGIPAEMLERIFELFAQVGSAQERSQGGLGIGLSLARRLVELHGGTLHAESDGPDRGSCFVIDLPLPAQAAERPAPIAVRDPAADGTRPRRVLVVDDNRDAAETLGMLLELEGHAVRMVHSGQDALAAAAQETPEVIFLDIGLPDIDGYQVATSLRDHPHARNALLVALTGWGAERDRERSRAAGFDLHLTKPVTPDDIARALSGG